VEQFSNEDLERAILEALRPSTVGSLGKAHKMTIIGRGDAEPGMIEARMAVQFTRDERARAAQTFEQLKRNGYIQSTLDDVVDPENWVTITEAGAARHFCDWRLGSAGGLIGGSLTAGAYH
jgi:hypothetical protein